MKFIRKNKKIKIAQNVNKTAFRVLALIVGVFAITFVIYETYRYFSQQSEASTPTVNYSFEAGGCTTSPTQKTCTLNGKNVNDTIDIDVKLEAVGSAKISGADLIFAYNIGEIEHMKYLGYTPLNLKTEFVNQTHASPQPQATRLLHLAIVDTSRDSNLFSEERIRLKFKVLKPGTSRLALITSGSTIVGPGSADAYILSPQNGLKNPGSADGYENIINIKVSTSDSALITPTSTVTPTVLTVTPTVLTVTPTVTPGAGLQDISINFRFKIQGVTSQPKNSSPIEFEIALVENTKARPPFKLSMQPQADGTYVGNTEIKGVNISSDAHSFLIKGPKHLRKKICQNQPTETSPGVYKCDKPNIRFVPNANTINFSSIYMLAGDLPVQNGIVDSVDLAYLRANAGSREVEALSRADLNFDNIVDTQDYALVINALGFKYDD